MKRKFVFLFSIFLLLGAVSLNVAQINQKIPKQDYCKTIHSSRELKKIIAGNAMPDPKRNEVGYYCGNLKIKINKNGAQLSQSLVGARVPDYSLTYKSVNNDWVLEEGSWYTYDNDGATSDITWKIWNGANWINDAWLHFTLTFVADMYLTSTMEWCEWKSNSWQKFLKEDFTYDQYGNNTQLVTESWHDGNTTKMKHEYSYINVDNQWLIEDDHGFLWIEALSAYQNSSWYHYEYDGVNLFRETYSWWIGTDWNAASRSTYYYDSNNRQIDEYGDMWVGAQWLQDTWSHWTYYDGPDQSIYYKSREDYNYSETGTWEPDWKTEYSYNNDWYETEILHSEYNGAEFVYYKGYFYSYFYDQTPPYDESIEKYWFASGRSLSGWADSSKTVNYYLEVVNVEPENIVPMEYSLSNYPNPFNPSTTIEFSLPVKDEITISIYDITGNLVTKLISNKDYSPGTYKINWDGKNSSNDFVSTGIYFYQIKTKSFTTTNKCILLK